MESMERQFRTNMQRETGRSARALGKIKAKCAADVRAAEFVAQADANFWRKRALASERRAGRAMADVKRLKMEMTKAKSGAIDLASTVDKVKERLESEQ